MRRPVLPSSFLPPVLHLFHCLFHVCVLKPHQNGSAGPPVMKRRVIKYANSQRKDKIRAVIGVVVFTAAQLHKSLRVFFIYIICPPPHLFFPLFWKIIQSTKKKESLQLDNLQVSQPCSHRDTQRFLLAQVCTPGLDRNQEELFFPPSLGEAKLARNTASCPEVSEKRLSSVWKLLQRKPEVLGRQSACKKLRNV